MEYPKFGTDSTITATSFDTSSATTNTTTVPPPENVILSVGGTYGYAPFLHNVDTGSTTTNTATMPPPENVILSVGSTTATTAAIGTYPYSLFPLNFGTNGTSVGTTTSPFTSGFGTNGTSVGTTTSLFTSGFGTNGTSVGTTTSPFTLGFGTNGTFVGTTTSPFTSGFSSTITHPLLGQSFPHGTHTGGFEDALTPLPITFTELAAFAGVGMGYSSAMLTYMQLSRTETHTPFQSHLNLSAISASLLFCILIGLFVMVFIHRRETCRQAAVIVSHLVCILTTIASLLVTILLFIP